MRVIFYLIALMSLQNVYSLDVHTCFPPNYSCRDDEPEIAKKVKEEAIFALRKTLAEQGINIALQRDVNQKSPIHKAARAGCFSWVEQFIEWGGDVNDGEQSFDDTPLHYAVGRAVAFTNKPVFYGPAIKTIEVLLARGAKINATNNYGISPLHQAVLIPRALPLAQLLIERGADVNASQGTQIGTPLHVAANHKNVDLVNFLLSQGALVDSLDQNHETPLQLALRLPSYPYKIKPSEWSKALEVARVLLDAGADIEKNCARALSWQIGKRNLLQRAFRTRNLSLLSLLLEYGADIRLLDPRHTQRESYELFEEHSDLDLAKLLLAHDCEISRCRQLLGDEVVRQALSELDGPCSICFENLSGDQFHVLKDCWHRFCKSCLDDCLSFAEGNVTDSRALSCPDRNCGIAFGEEDVYDFTASDARLGDFQRLKLVHGLWSDPEHYKQCPTADCPMIYQIGSEPADLIVCGSCTAPYCSHCSHPHDSTMSCEHYRDFFHELPQGEEAELKALNEWLGAHTKACPGELESGEPCGMSFEKKSGCQYMKCPRCQECFCWDCGEAFGKAENGHTSVPGHPWHT